MSEVVQNGDETNGAPVVEMAAVAIESKELNPTNGAAAEPEAAKDKPEGAGNFKEQFKAFSKFGDTKSDGKLITLSQSDKWMKQAKVSEWINSISIFTQ